jgi:hypothetical protein
MKKLRLLAFPVLFFFTANASFSQTKHEPLAEKKEAITLETAIKDFGFPQLKNTGNTQSDYEEYKNAKIEWIKNNPNIYEQMFPKTIQPANTEKRHARQVNQNIPLTN